MSGDFFTSEEISPFYDYPALEDARRSASNNSPSDSALLREDVGWYYPNTGSSTNEVKKKQANELGIYDMSGNVFEWCQDSWEKYSPKKQKNPIGKGDNRLKVIRSGGWNKFDGPCTVFYRDFARYNERRNNIGLRLAADYIK